MREIFAESSFQHEFLLSQHKFWILIGYSTENNDIASTTPSRLQSDLSRFKRPCARFKLKFKLPVAEAPTLCSRLD